MAIATAITATATEGAANAFLKTLEEPPAHAIFVLATTEKHKIIPTILSRCQIFDFNRIKVEDAVEYLKQIAEKEQLKYEEDALHIIARKADGATPCRHVWSRFSIESSIARRSR